MPSKQVPTNIRETPGFISLPWASDLFTNQERWNNALEEQGNDAKTLMKKLDQDFGTSSLPARTVLDRYFMGATGEAPSSGDAVMKLMAYRIADIHNWLQGRPAPRVQGEGSRVVKERILEQYSRLENWGEIVVQAYWDIMDYEPSPSTNIHLIDHYTTLCRQTNNARGEVIMHNFRKAAFHLRFLVEGHLDLPANIGKLEEYLRSRFKGTRSECVLLEEHWYRGRPKIGTLRHPLFFALACTPIILLIGTSQIDGKPLSMDKLFQFWRGISLFKPEPMIEVERLVWRMLWDLVADPGLDLKQGIIEMLREIQPIIVKTDKLALEWFQSPQQSTSVPPSPTQSQNPQPEQSTSVPPSPIQSQTPPSAAQTPSRSSSPASPDSRDTSPAVPEDSQGASSDSTIGENAAGDAAGEVPGPSSGDTINVVTQGSQKRKVQEDSGEASPPTRPRKITVIGPKTLTPATHIPKPKGKGKSRSKEPSFKSAEQVNEQEDEEDTVVQKKMPGIPGFMREQSVRVIVKDLNSEYVPRFGGVARVDAKEKPTKVRSGGSLAFHNFSGDGMFYWKPSFHFIKDLNYFNEMYKAATKRRSRVCEHVHIMKYDEFLAMTHGEVLHMLRSKHLLLTHGPVKPRKFDLLALGRLTSINKTISIQDQSIDVSPEYGNQRARMGTLRDLADAACSEDGKCLNALDFPGAEGTPIELPFASDRVAWRQIAEENWCKEDSPTTVLHWGLCATCGAFHYAHEDCDGAGTFVSPESGKKLWFTAVPKEGRTYDDFAKLNFFLDGWDPAGPNSDRVDWLPLVLEPGMTFVMRPNTPHAVFTLEHSVCFGGHYFATSTLRDTCYGLYHSFTAGSISTNASHEPQVLMILSRMIIWFHSIFVMGDGLEGVDDMIIDLGHDDAGHHLPDLSTFDGILDLCSVFCVFELANVLSQWSYVKPETHFERLRMMYTREKARHLQDWVFRHYELLDSEGNTLDHREAFFWPYLAQQARALILCKEKAVNAGFHHRVIYEQCTVSDVKEVVKRSMQTPDGLWKAFLDTSVKVDTFAWTGQRFEVRKIEVPQPSSWVPDIGYLPDDCAVIKSLMKSNV